MGSRLYVDTTRPDSRFRRVSPNVFALAKQQTNEIRERIESINLATRTELHGRLLAMPFDRFEALIGDLLLAIGFDEATVQVTRKSADGGIDVRGVLRAGGITEVNAAVQLKRWKQNVQAPTVQAQRGSLVVHEQGVVITTSKFSRGAELEAQALGKTRINLVDGDMLLDLLIAHRLGVVVENYSVHSLDREWWPAVIEAETDAPLPVALAPVVPADITYPIPIRATARGRHWDAELLSASGRTLFHDKEFESPSGAGQAAAGWKSCNGWTVWRYQFPSSLEWRAINELRVR
jgi:restriction system protein